MRQGDLEKRPLGVGVNTPAIRHYLEGLAASPFTSGTLSQAVEINPRVDSRELPDDFPVSFLPMEAVEDRGAGGFRLQTRPLVEVSKGYTPFGEGDIVWAKIAPCMQNGKSTVVTGLKNGLGFGSTEFHVLRPRFKQVLAEYVWYFLSFGRILEVAQAAFTGSAGQQRVPVEFLRDLPFPLPPLPVQQELVAAMNTARALRQQQLAEAEEVVTAGDAAVLALLGLVMPPPDSRGVFAMRLGQLQAVGRIDADYYRPGHLAVAAALAASPYPVQALGSLCESPVGGSTPRKGDQEAYTTTGIRFLRICNIRPNTFDLSDLNFILPSVHNNELGRSQLAVDDVLLTITGRVGTAAVVTPDLLPANMNQHLVRLRVMEGGELEPDYLSAYLNTSLGLAISNRPVTGGTRIALDYEAIKNLPIPVPPPAVQREVVAEVQRRRAQARQLRKAAETGWAASKAAFEARLLA